MIDMLFVRELLQDSFEVILFPSQALRKEKSDKMVLFVTDHDQNFKSHPIPSRSNVSETSVTAPVPCFVHSFGLALFTGTSRCMSSRQ